jgi:hypothetical protein
MSIKIAATLSIGILIFSLFVPTIILEETLGENNTFIARLVLGIAMIVVAAMELGVIVLSRNTTMHSRLNWLLPKYCEDPETRQSILKPAGIALFCIVGVYSIDVMFAIAEMSCDEYMALCDSTTSRQGTANLFFHFSRICFSTVSTLFCFIFRTRRFVGGFFTLLTLSVACVTALSLWFELVLEESYSEHHSAINASSYAPPHSPAHSNSSTDPMSECFSSSFSPVLSPGILNAVSECVQQRTSAYLLIENAKPYLYPLIGELMMLFAEAYAAWFFSCVLVDYLKRSGIGPILSTSDNSQNSSMRSENSSDSMAMSNEQSPLLSGEPRTSNIQPMVRMRQVERYMCQYLMVLGTGLLSTLFIILGILFYYTSQQPESNFGITFAHFRIVYWIIFTTLTLVGVVAVKIAKHVLWADSPITGFEFFVLLCHVGMTLFSTLTIVAMLISKDDNEFLPLYLTGFVLNVAQFYSQVLFYFWAKGVQRPPDELLDSSRRVTLCISLLEGIVLSLAVLNLAMWFEDSFVETARKASDSIEKEFYDLWPTLYNVFNPIRLLFRFNSAVMFYELHHKLSTSASSHQGVH